MDSSDILDIQILKFINPHIFYITTDLDNKHRASQLQKITDRIKRLKIVPYADDVAPPDNEIVAVYHEGHPVRATIFGQLNSDDIGQNCYSCWLIDHAVLIKTNKIYGIPKELQKITPRCKQAGLNNICYFHEKLELGVTGTKKLIPGLMPSAGTIQCALDLISNSEKLQMKVAERFGDILFGEIKIYKEGKILFLTQELVKRELVGINEVMFTGLKYGTKEFLKSQIGSIYQTKKAPVKHEREILNSEEKNAITQMVNALQVEIEEMDVSDLPPLENGRRRKNRTVTAPTTPEIEKGNASFPEKTDSEQLNTSTPNSEKPSELKMIQKKKQEEQEESKKITDAKEDVANTKDRAKNALQKAIEFKKRRLRMSESSEGKKSL